MLIPEILESSLVSVQKTKDKAEPVIEARLDMPSMTALNKTGKQVKRFKCRKSLKTTTTTIQMQAAITGPSRTDAK